LVNGDGGRRGLRARRRSPVPPKPTIPSLPAQRAGFHARLGSHRHGERDYRAAETLFAEHGVVFRHAVTQLEHAEWLTSHARADEAGPLLIQARETFERLEATPWLERLNAALMLRVSLPEPLE
jgi:hypothetical protein